MDTDTLTTALRSTLSDTRLIQSAFSYDTLST